jgi:hypothetical protein
MLWWEPYFVFYFAFCSKFLIPMGLWFLLLFTIQRDINVPYGDYSWRWQLAGLVVPVLGIVLFIFFSCCCLHEVDLPEHEFEEDLTKKEIKQYKKEKKAQMASFMSEEQPLVKGADASMAEPI